jgi:diguanylate cyclase (GGDEF)-like protein
VPPIAEAPAAMMPDTPTLFLVGAVFCGLAALLQTLAFRRLDTASVRFWIAANLAFCFGCLVFMMRAALPLPVSVLVGNGSVILGMALVAAGMAAFAERRPRVAEIAAGPLLTLAALAIALARGDDHGERALIASLAISYYAVRTAVSLLGPRQQRLIAARTACAALTLAFAAAYLTRGVGLAVGLLGSGDTFDNLDGGLVRVFAFAAAAAWAVCSFVLTFDRIATQDELTGLPNRRAALASGDALFGPPPPLGGPLSVLMVDLDAFKQINDTFGHGVGDEVLSRFAVVARQSMRSGDIVARIGGEEFCVLLPDTDARQASVVAERLRRACEQSLRIVAGHATGVTVSVGLAIQTGDDNSVADLLKRADQALYFAKALGRNRVAGTEDFDTDADRRTAG